MQHIDRILVSLDEDEHGALLVKKALQLRDHVGAELVFVRCTFDPVLEDEHMHFTEAEHDQVVALLVEAEEIKFSALLATFTDDTDWDTEVVWSKQPWQAVIDAAHARGCDLIVKDAYVETRLDEVVHSPHEWALLRNADVPTMMIKPKRWKPGANVVAAIDVFDSRKHELNDRVIGYAASLATLLDGKLHIANALPSLQGAVLQRGTFTSYVKMKHTVEAQRREYMERLVEEAGATCEGVHVVAGHPAEAIGGLVEALDAELMVVGKIRPGVHQLLGTTAEHLLHKVNCDVVSVV